MLRHLQRKIPDSISLTVYDRDAEVRQCLASQRKHPHHSADTPVRDEVRIADSTDELLADLDALILAVTSNSTREVIANIAEASWAQPLVIINTAKALDFQTGCRLSELVTEGLANSAKEFVYSALAGGTIASDLLQHEPLGMTVACQDAGALSSIGKLISSRNLWVEATTDLVGVEYAGAFKNVIAICAGMVHGLGYSYGSTTHLISRLAREIETLCVTRLGAQQGTFSTGSQCWGSDLWMSCTGKTRNQELGRLLGEGRSLDDANQAMAQKHKTVEGVQTLRATQWLVREYASELPLLSIAKEIILDGAPASRLIDALMNDEDVS